VEGKIVVSSTGPSSRATKYQRETVVLKTVKDGGPGTRGPGGGSVEIKAQVTRSAGPIKRRLGPQGEQSPGRRRRKYSYRAERSGEKGGKSELALKSAEKRNRRTTRQRATTACAIDVGGSNKRWEVLRERCRKDRHGTEDLGQIKAQ